MSKLLLVMTSSVPMMKTVTKSSSLQHQGSFLLMVDNSSLSSMQFKGNMSSVVANSKAKFMSPWPRYMSSTWPISSAFMVAQVLLGLCLWFHDASVVFFSVSFTIGLLCAMGWVRELIVEGSFLGMYTSYTHRGLKYAVWMFIVSEAMFFVSFFWAYCHFGFAAGFFLGCRWPPVGITPIHPMGLPFFNLTVLLSSSVTINLSHGYLRAGNRLASVAWLLVTLFLGAGFFSAQLKEYYWSKFTITDGVWGSSFFMLTGLHGFHVFLGMGLISFNLIRLLCCHYHSGENISFMSMLWYWHFVDFIWVIIWPLVYVWGSWGYFHYSLWMPWEVFVNLDWGSE